jgi:hypothetical protein
MNLDERLEALVQSVELLATMHRENEKRVTKIVAAIERVDQRELRLEVLVTEIAEGTARLLHAVEAHEERIAGLENKQRPQ